MTFGEKCAKKIASDWNCDRSPERNLQFVAHVIDSLYEQEKNADKERLFRAVTDPAVGEKGRPWTKETYEWAAEKVSEFSDGNDFMTIVQKQLLRIGAALSTTDSLPQGQKEGE